MKKIKILGLSVILATSTVMAADVIKTNCDSNLNDSPFSIKLEAGVAMPLSNEVSMITGLKNKSKISPTGTLAFGYDINNDVSVNYEIGYTYLTNKLNEQVEDSKMASSLLYSLIITDKTAVKGKDDTHVLTNMFGVNYNFYNDNDVVLFAGAGLGVAAKITSIKYQYTPIQKDYIFKTQELKGKRMVLAPAYAVKIGAQYKVADNVNINATYALKGIGASATFKKESKVGIISKKPTHLHMITAGVSYSF